MLSISDELTYGVFDLAGLFIFGVLCIDPTSEWNLYFIFVIANNEILYSLE